MRRNICRKISRCSLSIRTVRPKDQGNVVQQVSPAEELKKFKELLDMGIITQEEFDVKKKQILGL